MPDDEQPLITFAAVESDDGEGLVQVQFRPSEMSPTTNVTLENMIIVAHSTAEGTLVFGGCSVFLLTLENSAHLDDVEVALDRRWSRTSPARDDEPLEVTIDDLIRQPRVFAGRVVRTQGYARFSWDHCCILFATLDARRHFDGERAVGLQLIPLSQAREPLLAGVGAGAIPSLRPFASGPASVTGVFVIGDDELRVGRLVNVMSFVALATDGSEDLAATFDQGMAGKLDPPSAAIDVER